MRIGLYGGSFDPVHRGHVDPVAEAAQALGLDRVFYLPTADPPHKGPRAAAVHRRYAMVELALLQYPDFLVSDFEMTPGRTAYTVETVHHFGAAYPEAELFLLLGSDSFINFPQWRQWREITELATLVVLARPGSLATGSSELPEALEHLVQQGVVRFVENEPLPFASRSVRSSIAAGEETAIGVLSPLVLEYICKYDLYR